MITYDFDIIEKIHCKKSLIFAKSEIYKREDLKLFLKTNGNNKLLVIMMNPSTADDNISDRTINKILKYFKNGYCHINNDNNDIINLKYISIVNLFSICCPNSKELNSYFDQISQYGSEILAENISENRNVIKDKLLESNYIVLGWGNCPEHFYEICFYKEAINVINLLRELKKKTYMFSMLKIKGYL